MEINFGLLVIAALAGLIVNAIWGFNPWAILGSLSLLVLLSPMLGLAFQTDPQVVQSMADVFINRIINEFPSLIIGEVAGTVAATIFKAFKGVF